MPRFEKGSQEAKDYMAALRAKRKPKYSAEELNSYQAERVRQRQVRERGREIAAEQRMATEREAAGRRQARAAATSERRDVKSAAKSKKKAEKARDHAKKLIELLRKHSAAFDFDHEKYTEVYNILVQQVRHADLAINAAD